MDPQPIATTLFLSAELQSILDYLEDNLPDYPFDRAIDQPFVRELLDDHDHIDVLEQIKLFRWYYDNQPPLKGRARSTLRRWITKARR